MNLGFDAPKVFISYSHDSQEHKDRILDLANRLRAEGVDCDIDQYENSPAEGWPRWIMNQLEWADFVVVVCTQQYEYRFRGKEEPGTGRGVTWEGAIISQELYDSHVKSTKFIPVVFSSEDGSFIPVMIRGFSRYDLYSEEGYKAFYCHLTNQPQNPRPPLGSRLEFPPRVLASLPPRDHKQNFPIDPLVQKVRPYYEKRYGILKVLGMRKPVNLELIYTAVQFLDNEAISSSESLEDLKQLSLEPITRRFLPQAESRQEGIEVANDEQYLMVLGGPGAGKSTFLRKIGLEALKGTTKEFKHDCIPVLINLKDFTSTDINIKNIENFIAEEFCKCELPEPKQFTATALREGKLLILLDGLDEVIKTNSNNITIIEEIQKFVDIYDKNRFILSCRIGAYLYNLRRFTDVTIANFNDFQIEKFISNWFSSKPDLVKDCWDKLKSDKYTAAKELTQTPLLLTLVCWLYERSGKIPTNRANLYKKALSVLLEEWAAEKSITQKDFYKGLDTECKEIILSKIAHDAFQKGRLFLPKQEIAKKIQEMLEKMLPDEKVINGVNVLKSIEVQHGVLVERADSIYSFSHLTLQEYLTAQYIHTHKQFEQLVTEHLTDKHWKEVFLLVAGLIQEDADNLLLLMEKEVKKHIINTRKLQALLNWAEQATTGSAGDFKPVGKRAVAIAIAISYAITYANAITYAEAYTNFNPEAIAYANTIANAYTEAYAIVKVYAEAYANFNTKAIAIAKTIAKSIANANTEDIVNAITYANAEAIAITKAINYARQIEEFKIFNNVNFTVLIDKLKELADQIPDEKQPEEVRNTFLKSFHQTLINAFNISPDIINLSYEDIRALENYLYVNNLIIQCNEASLLISPETWKDIEAKMLKLDQ